MNENLFEPTPQRLVTLTVKNFMKITIGVLHFPKGVDVFELSSNNKNAQGKSSILTALSLIVQGRKAIPADVIKKGARKAVVICETTDYKMKAEINSKQKISYTIVIKETGEIQNNRKLIDAIMGNKSIDPVGFNNMSALEQFKSIMDMVPEHVKSDMTDLDAKISEAYEERKLLNRDVRDMQVEIDEIPFRADDFPTELISTDGISALFTEEQRKTEAIQEYTTKLILLDEQQMVNESHISKMEKDIKELNAKLDNLINNRNSLREAVIDIESKRKKLPRPDLEAPQREMAEIVEKNIEIQRCLDDKITLKKFKDKSMQVEALTIKIDDYRNQKGKLLASVDFGTPDITIDPDERIVLYNGLPLKGNASDAESIIAAATIQLQSLGSFKVLSVRQASMIGEKLRAELLELAYEYGCQIIFESLIGMEDNGVIIEDGVITEIYSKYTGGAAAAARAQLVTEGGGK